MKTAAEFLDAIRVKHALTSDNKLALHMGWDRQSVRRYRNAGQTFDDANSIKVAAQLGIEPAYVMACMAWHRAKTPETRSAWERIAAKVAAAFLMFTVGTGAILHNRSVRADTSAPDRTRLHICANFARRALRSTAAALSALGRCLGVTLSGGTAR